MFLVCDVRWHFLYLVFLSFLGEDDRDLLNFVLFAELTKDKSYSMNTSMFFPAYTMQKDCVGALFELNIRMLDIWYYMSVIILRRRPKSSSNSKMQFSRGFISCFAF